MSGFEFRETMSGSFHLATDPLEERPISFSIRARSRSLWSFARTPDLDIEGEVDAEGFADHKHLRGTLGLYLLKNGTLVYSFSFRANDGTPCLLEGTKHVTLGTLPESMTVLPATLRSEGGETLGDALLRFDLRSDLVRFVRSFRPTF